MHRDFPVRDYNEFVGLRLVKLEQDPFGDEGFKMTFENGKVLRIYFSGCEGMIVKERSS